MCQGQLFETQTKLRAFTPLESIAASAIRNSAFIGVFSGDEGFFSKYRV